MGFDFAKAEKAAEASSKAAPTLAAVVLGQSSAGKSFLAGTLPGKTLFLYTQGEEHGKDSAKLSAKAKGSKVVAVCVDIDDEGKVLGHDSAYKRLLAILQDVDGIKKAGFGNVVVDGLTELESLVRATSMWAMNCKTNKGDHNNFAEPDATIKCIRPILEALRTLQRDAGLNYYVTCSLIVKGMEENGEITHSEPKLMGYEVAAQLIPQFPDQIMIGRMTNSEGKEGHRIQFSAKASKVVKEKSGEIKKLIGFTPRLRGVPSDKLPATMAADLSAVLKLKEETGK